MKESELSEDDLELAIVEALILRRVLEVRVLVSVQDGEIVFRVAEPQRGHAVETGLKPRYLSQ